MKVMTYLSGAILGLMTFSSVSASYDNGIAGKGRVRVFGSVIDSACAIDIGSRDQVIDMGTVPLSDIIRDGQGKNKSFTIKLINCVTKRIGKADWKQFRVTFDGTPDGDLFGVSGEASGVALRIISADGSIARPGEVMPPVDITSGSMELNYSLKLMANSHVLKAGSYSSSISFKLDYF